MPTLPAQNLEKIACHLLGAAGAPDEHASVVASHLTSANLAGHDSHGFIRIPQYLREIREGTLDPAGQPEVARENKSITQVNGNNTFGQVVATYGARIAIANARKHGISLVGMYNLTHTGRIGTYPEMAAREGMAAMMYDTAVGPGGGSVAPFGGLERKLGTNPISMSFPSSSDEVILLDFATSIGAEGKLRVYRARGHSLPDEWVLSKEGVPSRDPNDYYAGGSILPLGGLSGGHKGYALSFMVVLFGALLGGLGAPGAEWHASTPHASTMVVVDLASLAPLEDVRAQVEELVKHMKSSSRREGAGDILYPGEFEARNRKERLVNGIAIEDATWNEVGQLIKDHGLEQKLQSLKLI